MKGAQLSTKNHRYTGEFSGIFGKRFILGLEEYHDSTRAERDHVVKLWKAKGFAAQLAKRGDVKDDDFPCPIEGCTDKTTHVHLEEQDEETVKVAAGNS
jgi:hypothetical protein